MSGLRSEVDAIYQTLVESQAIRVVSYPAAWAGFNMVSDGAAAAQAWMANDVQIVAAATVAANCLLVGVSLGLPQVEAFQADIRISVGGAGAEVDYIEVPCGTNVWPVVEWHFPVLLFPLPIRLVGQPRLAYNMRKSTAASAAGFNICHLVAVTGVGT